MRISGIPWTGAHQAIPNAYGAAESDQRAGLLLKNAAWEHEFKQRDQFNALLRRQADYQRQKKAAKKKNAWGGLIGTGAGTALGAALAVPTGGMSMLAGGALGGALGGSTGGAIDYAMGNNGSGGMQLGNTLMDFSTEFLPINPNPYYQAAMQGGGGGGGEFMYDQYGGGGMAMPPNRREY